MREIKFRAWDSFASKMWNEVYFDGGHIFTIGGDGENASTMPRLDDNPLMQYTGIKDQNGKEIYEGDILQCGWHPNNRGVVEFRDGGIHYNLGVPENSESQATDSTIIGNIYENPELVKQ